MWVYENKGPLKKETRIVDSLINRVYGSGIRVRV